LAAERGIERLLKRRLLECPLDLVIKMEIEKTLHRSSEDCGGEERNREKREVMIRKEEEVLGDKIDACMSQECAEKT
jgi:hypothetical protein